MKNINDLDLVREGFLDGHGDGTTNYAYFMLNAIKQGFGMADLPFELGGSNTLDGGFIIEIMDNPGPWYMVIRPADPPYLSSYDGEKYVMISPDMEVFGDLVSSFGNFIKPFVMGWVDKYL